MASLILGTAGSLLGPLGGVAGSLIGGLIDQWIFGSMQDPIEGPKLDELRFPSFDEGSPAPWVQGRLCRVPCQILWCSAMRDDEVQSGGKGGSGPQASISHEYYVDVAIAFARQTLNPASVSKPMRKLWANGELLYEAEIGIDRTSNAVAITKSTVNANFSTSCTNKPYKEYITFQHETGNFFKGVRAGANVVVSGAANAANNGTWMVDTVTLDADGVAGRSRIKVFRCSHSWALTVSGFTFTCTDTSSCIAGVTASAGASIRFQQNGLEEFDPELIEAVTQYRGTFAQALDPLIDAKTFGYAPAYRGTAYAVIKNLKVTQWGGTLPAFEALIDENTTRTVGEALTNILTRNGALTADDIDVSAVTGSLVGLSVMGPRPPKELVRLIMLVYGLDVQLRPTIESGVFKTKLVFFPVGSAQERTVANGDRGALASDSEGSQDLLKVEQLDPDLLPGEVTVTFLDPDREYQPGSRTFRRGTAHTENQTRISLPMVLSSSNALALAKRILWLAHSNERLRIQTTLPPTYVDLIESDQMLISDLDGRQIRARVTKTDRGANGLIEVEAMEEVESVFAEPVTGEDVPGV